jgi:hypothetical protein
MFKKTVTYDDYDGNQRTEDFYFHLSAAELVEMEAGQTGGMEAHLNAIIKSGDGKEIVKLFTDLIRQAYGKKSDDGRRFQKSEEIWNDFFESSAYDILFMSLVTDANQAAEFANAILPQKMMAELKEKQAKLVASPEMQKRAAEAVRSIETVQSPIFNPELIKSPPENAPKRRLEDYTREELVALPQEEYTRLLRGRNLPFE